MLNFFTVTVPLVAMVTTNTATLPFSSYKLQGPPPPVDEKPYTIIKEFEPETTAIREVAIPKLKEKRLICKGCSEHEQLALDYFQDQGIKDRNALATILGNIKQESIFVPNICEGGSRTSYYNCGRGYGLIQFTSASRYYGLGAFAKKIGGNPSTADTQLRYITTEPQWKSIENRMRVSGKSIDRYMNYAYEWIGWGHHGARTQYAYDYAKRLVLADV